LQSFFITLLIFHFRLPDYWLLQAAWRACSGYARIFALPDAAASLPLRHTVFDDFHIDYD
jgi:hypothetical protein